MGVGDLRINAYNTYMELRDQLPEHEPDPVASMPDSAIEAIGTLLAAAARWLRDNHHWLSVALLLSSASRALAFATVERSRSARQRALTSVCTMAATFAVLLRHLSRPPQVWAAQ
ncbi:MAG: hypothetical protein ACSLE1_04895 [Sphingobium sp.]